MRSRTRPPVVQDAIVAHVRGRILEGKLGPGERLPARSEIERRFGASSVTVQRAFDRLVADGFVAVEGRRGTFVSERPPHIYRYVIAFPAPSGDPAWVRFWTVLSDVAREMERDEPFRIDTYVGINRHEPGEDYHRLLEDVSERRLAGIVFATNPFLVEGTPLVTEPWLPRVAIMPPPAPEGVTALSLDQDSFFDRALDFLASRGRRRIAMITVPGIEGEKLDRYRKGLAERGMASRPQWIQTAHQSEPRWAANLALLMLRGGQGDRPDGLVITDDNLVEHACAGIVESGARVPKDLEVVAHCNFPPPSDSALAIRRLGYDGRKLLETCLDLIDRRRSGRKVAAATAIKAVFESDLRGGE